MKPLPLGRGAAPVASARAAATVTLRAAARACASLKARSCEGQTGAQRHKQQAKPAGAGGGGSLAFFCTADRESVLSLSPAL